MTIKATTLAFLLLAGTTLSPLPLLAQDAAGSQKMIPPATQSQQNDSQDAVSPKGVAAGNTAQMQQPGNADTKADAQLKSQPGSADAGNRADAQLKPQDNQSGGAAAAGADKRTSTDQAQSEQMKKPGDTNTAAQADQKPKSNNNAEATQKPSPTDQTTAQSTKQSSTQDQQSAQGAHNGSTETNRSTTATSDTTNQTNINNTNSASAERPSNEITGSINISTEQKTEIRNVIVENKVEAVKPTFSVSVGVSVPKTVKLHRLPPKVVEIVPQYRSYEYFVLADNRIVIVEPSTYEIVDILVV
jgi:hypothetical protein